MNLMFSVIALALLGISVATAQGVDCKTIKDSTARLKCFDALSTPSQKATVLDVAKDAVTNKLRDPESARFRNIRSAGEHGAAGEIICGEVNAKNSNGGYTGFKKFHYSAAAKRAFIPGSYGLTDDILDQIAAPSDRFCGRD